MTGSFAGIDGCRGGWFAAVGGNGCWNTGLYKSIRDFWSLFNSLELVLIDIPIGIQGVRDCEKLARKLLPPGRKSTIFNPPVKEALDIKDYRHASEINYAYSGRKLSRQSFNLIPKIREVNDFLAADKQARKIFYESHPEICFSRMLKNQILYNKKTAQGRRQRLDVLKPYWPEIYDLYQDSANRFKRKMVAYDDIIDTLVLAVTAGKGYQKLKFIPPETQYDHQGLRMQIAF